jgi:hypothetical protein
MPHLVKVQETYKEQGLIVIAPHSQGVSREKVLELCREKGVNYTVTDNARFPWDTGRGIPKCYVFDHNGEIIYDGRGDGIEPIIEEALAKAPDWLLGENNYSELKSEASSIIKRSNLGKTLATLRTLVAGGEDITDAEQEEAGRMIDRLLPWAELQVKKVKDLMNENPEAALAGWKNLAKQFKGDLIGDEADATYKELKKDEDFKEELKAWKAIAKIIKAVDANPAALNPSRGALEKVIDKYPDTAAARRAMKMIESIK